MSSTKAYDRYENLPAYMRDGAKNYVEHGIPPGGFLYSVLTNDLCGAVGRADPTNAKDLHTWAMWLYNDVPSNAWGNATNVNKWCEMGGLEGVQKTYNIEEATA